MSIYMKKNEVSATPIKILNEQYCDASWCTLLDGPSVITLGCIYRSPSAQKDTSILINSLITQASKLDGRLLVIGDFNYPGINWSDWTTQHGELHEEFLFIESLRDNFLIQHISESTRYREGNEPSTIDLLISNEESDINSITILPGIGLSDHCLLLFEYFCYQKESHSDESQTFMKYDSCDYMGFCEQWSNIDWETEFVDSNIEDMWNIFKCKYESSVEQFVPKKVIKAGKRKKPLWMNSETLHAVKTKHNSWEKYRFSRQDNDYKLYCIARNKATKLIRNAKRVYEQGIFSKVKDDAKHFWKYMYVKSKTSVKSTISQLKNEQGDLVDDSKGKAGILNDYFSSVFTRDDTSNRPDLQQRPSVSSLEHICVDQELVKRYLLELKSGKSMGLDNIHPAILKHLAEVFAKPLTLIFQASIDSEK